MYFGKTTSVKHEEYHFQTLTCTSMTSLLQHIIVKEHIPLSLRKLNTNCHKHHTTVQEFRIKKKLPLKQQTVSIKVDIALSIHIDPQSLQKWTEKI